MRIPKRIIHGTTNVGSSLIKEHGILERGFNVFGKQKKPSSLDFGEGFYCSYSNNITCITQVNRLSVLRATASSAQPLILSIEVDQAINHDSTLKCVFFDGRLNVDGLEWARFVIHHRVKKDKALCNEFPCNGHPDVMIGPVADGENITALAHSVKTDQDLLDFYHEVNKADWFPEYKQMVFSENAIKYLKVQF